MENADAESGRRHHVMLSRVGVKAVGCHVLTICGLFCELGVFLELSVMPLRTFFDGLSAKVLRSPIAATFSTSARVSSMRDE
jgi:hypothetical protein